jgi:hypothetical protein
LFLGKLKKVSQYTIQKRKVFIVKDIVDEEEPRIETKEISEEAKAVFGTRRAISVAKALNEKEKKLNLTITNTAGFTLEKIQIRIALVDEVFESKPWVTSVKEMFPYESIDVGYPVDALEGALLVEATSDLYGKIFSRTIKFAPKKE